MYDGVKAMIKAENEIKLK